MKCLLDAGANEESFCGDGRNALQCAAHAGSLSTDVLSWLTKDYKQREDIAKYINLPDQSQGRRAAHYVAGSPLQEIKGVNVLEDAGTDWTLKDQAGNTPFEWAAKRRRWIMTSRLAMIQWKTGDLTKSVDVDFVPGCDWTHVSVQNVSGKSAH